MADIENCMHTFKRLLVIFLNTLFGNFKALTNFLFSDIFEFCKMKLNNFKQI